MAPGTRRVRPTLSQERRLWQQGSCAIAGVDEVGIGPLAGPVVAAAVMFPARQLASDTDIPGAWPQGVRDSKTLTATARQRLDADIRRVARAIGLGLVEVEEIDRIKAGPNARGWSEADKLMLQATDELRKDAFITDATWNGLCQHFDSKQLMDVVFAVGQYNLVSMALNTLGVQLDDGLEGF